MTSIDAEWKKIREDEDRKILNNLVPGQILYDLDERARRPLWTSEGEKPNDQIANTMGATALSHAHRRPGRHASSPRFR
jgi:hypothetical protein